MRTITLVYLWAQVIFSVIVILFGLSYAIRCLITTVTTDKGASGYVTVALFSLIAFAGWRLMYRASIKELQEIRIRK